MLSDEIAARVLIEERDVAHSDHGAGGAVVVMVVRHARRRVAWCVTSVARGKFAGCLGIRLNEHNAGADSA